MNNIPRKEIIKLMRNLQWLLATKSATRNDHDEALWDKADAVITALLETAPTMIVEVKRDAETGGPALRVTNFTDPGDGEHELFKIHPHTSQTTDEWRPIDTAPKDGTHIQLYLPKTQFVGYYGGADSGWRYNAPGQNAVWPLPTHWKPLTKPPHEETKQ